MVYVKGLLPTLSAIVSSFRNGNTRSELTLERIIQFEREEGDAYRARYVASTSRTQVSTRLILPISVRKKVRLTVRRTRTSPPPRTPRDNRCVVSFMKPMTDLSTTAYQPVVSTAIESIFVMDDVGKDHTYSLPTVDHGSISTKIPHSDRDDEQLLTINHAITGIHRLALKSVISAHTTCVMMTA